MPDGTRTTQGSSSLIAALLCRLIGRHQYRNRVPQVFHAEVYCRRCGRVFGSFDAPFARLLWQQDKSARLLMMGVGVDAPYPSSHGDDQTVAG